MQNDEEKKDKLNRLERKLYSRNAPNIIDPGRSEFDRELHSGLEQAGEVRENWQDVKANGFDELAAKVSRAAQTKHGFLNKIFALSVVFFVVAVGVAIYVFWGGGNMVSSKNVDIKVTGPLAVPAGQEVSFDINIINSNNIDLNSASLLVEYPEGSRSPEDFSKEIGRERFDLGTIKSRESFRQNIEAVFFGEKDKIKEIKISLEYRVENSSALFYKEKLHEVSISSAPIILTPVYPKEVNSNQEISFEVEIASNSKDKIENFLVGMEYPFGFVFKDSSPKASFGNNVWKFSDLNSGEKKKITVRGNVIGQDNEEKAFRVSAGTASSLDERVIAVPFSELSESILVKKPFIGIDVLIEGEGGNFTGQGDSSIRTALILRNNLPSKLFNASVEVGFAGAAFNELSVVPSNGGFFQSANDTIIWDKRVVGGLADMEPGSKADLSFRLSPFSYANIKPGAKPEIEMTVTAKGERILESGSVEQVSAVETRKIILATNLDFSGRTVRSIGSLENQGPIPPKVDTPTTYTVIWSISNSFNQVSNVEVRATLPSYVKWTNLKSPDGEIIALNPSTDEVVWSVGSVLPNTGFGTSQKQVYFQLELLPSSSQLGQAPVILGETSVSGIDKVTGLKIDIKRPSVSTNFSGDPSYRAGDEKVVQ